MARLSRWFFTTHLGFFAGIISLFMLVGALFLITGGINQGVAINALFGGLIGGSYAMWYRSNQKRYSFKETP